jgi:CBS domain-containing protein
VADQVETSVAKEETTPRKDGRRTALPPRDITAFTTALLFVALGFAAIYIVAKVADVKDGVVLAVVLVVPALLYLMLSGRIDEFKGPGGLEVRLSEVAHETIPVPGDDSPQGALAYEELRAVEAGRRESFLTRTRDIMPAEPVILTLTLGCRSIDGEAALNYARGLAQFPRFRFVAILDSDQHRQLISYMEESAFRHLIEADTFDAQELFNNVEQQNVGAIRAFPGMVSTTVTPETSIVDALRTMERLRINALLVTEHHQVKGIVERERLANRVLLSLIEHSEA